MNRDLADQLQEARAQLQLWKAPHNAHTEAAAWLRQQEAKFQQLANTNMSGNNLADILPRALDDIKGLHRDLQKTKEAFLENSTLSDQLPQPAERSTPGLHSGQRHSLQTVACLEKMLLAKLNEFEVCLAFSIEWRLQTSRATIHLLTPVKHLYCLDGTVGKL